MFLTVDSAAAAFEYVRDHGVSYDKSAIEAELKYLPNSEENAITVEATGSFIILDGVCRCSEDAARAVRVATEIVGPERLISHLVVASISRV